MQGVVYEIQIGPYKQIGSTGNLKEREYHHLNLLKTNRHYNKYLQRVFNKYGKQYVLVVVEEFKTREEAYQEEQRLLDLYYKKPYYTMEHPKAVGGSNPGKNSFMYGKTHSEETKKKIGDKHRGKVVSKETRLKQKRKREGKVTCKNELGEFTVVTKEEYDNSPNLVGISAGMIKLKARKQVICEQDKLIHNGVKEAAAYYGVPPGQISENIRGKREKVGVKKYKGGLTFKLYLPE